jgi:hypothetical protein
MVNFAKRATVLRRGLLGMSSAGIPALSLIACVYFGKIPCVWPTITLCGARTLQLQAYNDKVKVKLLPPSTGKRLVDGAEQREEPNTYFVCSRALVTASLRLSTVFSFVA